MTEGGAAGAVRVAIALSAVGVAAVILAAPAVARDRDARPSLPRASSGERPGPSVLYEPPPRVPELSVHRPFRARPLLVSGTDAYRRGEYLYQDYLFDDRGANTVPSVGCCAPAAGDVRYPTAARYANNAADIVELRIKPRPRSLVYRVTLNTAKAKSAAVIGIGIDTDRSGGEPVAWPNRAGISSPGLDRFIAAWGSGGEVARLPHGRAKRLPKGAVRISRRTNQMTIRVPRRLMDPGWRTWRYVAGAGLWSGDGWLPVPAASEPTEAEPASGNPAAGAPGVFNLAFRFDEPQGVLDVPSQDTALGYGHWFEEEQARLLAQRSSGRFFADVDFAKLADRVSEAPHPPGRTQVRIHPSSLAVPEGFHPDAPEPEWGAREAPVEESAQYGGRLQPYMLHLPPRSSRRPGLTLALHGNTASHTQYSVFSPRYLRQVGDQRSSLVVIPLGRTTLGFGLEHEIFEVWSDLARRFSFDSRRVALSGYSAGGYGTFVLAIKYPDLFGRGWPIVGAARLLNGGLQGDSTNYIPMIGNLRWVPFMAWNQVVDELAPYPGIRLTQARFDELGLRSRVWSFPVGEHFTPAALDQWEGALDFLGGARVKRDPSRVDYSIAPATWDREHGLVADHAYWVSEVRLRDHSARDQTSTARGFITATSRAFGEGDPIKRRIASVYPGPPSPATIDGTAWSGLERGPKRNKLVLDLRNLRRATIDGERARLRADRPLTVSITSDGRARTRLVLPFPAGARVEPVGEPGSRTDVIVRRRRALFNVDRSTRTYVISPRR